jgi:hypothetical protein
MLHPITPTFTHTHIPDLAPDRETIEWLMNCSKFPNGGSVDFRFIDSDSDSGSSVVVDIEGDFNCSGQDLTDFKGVRFGRVSGSFICCYNRLKNLAGAPMEVGGIFDCGHNELINLIGAPAIVGGPIYFGNNRLVGLEGAPVRHGSGYETGPGIFLSNPVSEKTLYNIYQYMIRGFSYQRALGNSWNLMPEEDRILMYADNPDLSDDERRGYELMNRVKEISI